MRVLVTNSTYWNCLAAVRALGMCGVEAFVCGPRRESIIARQGVATWSRYCTKRLFYTDPADDPAQYADDIAGLLRTEGIDVFLPIGIKEVQTALQYEEILRPLAAIPFGAFGSVLRANDKSQAMRAAKIAKVPTPDTVEVESFDQLREIDIHAPFVVKTCVGAASQGVWMVHDPSQWSGVLRAIAHKRDAASSNSKLFLDTDRFIIQELIPGRVHDVCVLADHGKVKALLTQERIKTASLDGGAGHMNTTTAEPIPAEYARRLISQLEYHGPAQIEFIRDARDGTYRLLEVNAKFWGTLALSIEAGINFPALAVQLALGHPIEGSFDYEVGLTYRWRFPGEVISWARQRKQGASLKSVIASPGGRVRSDWRWDDPLPSLNQILTTIWKLVRKDWSE